MTLASGISPPVEGLPPLPPLVPTPLPDSGSRAGSGSGEEQSSWQRSGGCRSLASRRVVVPACVSSVLALLMYVANVVSARQLYYSAATVNHAHAMAVIGGLLATFSFAVQFTAAGRELTADRQDEGRQSQHQAGADANAVFAGSAASALCVPLMAIGVVAWAAYSVAGQSVAAVQLAVLANACCVVLNHAVRFGLYAVVRLRPLRGSPEWLDRRVMERKGQDTAVWLLLFGSLILSSQLALLLVNLYFVSALYVLDGPSAVRIACFVCLAGLSLFTLSYVPLVALFTTACARDAVDEQQDPHAHTARPMGQAFSPAAVRPFLWGGFPLVWYLVTYVLYVATSIWLSQRMRSTCDGSADACTPYASVARTSSIVQALVSVLPPVLAILLCCAVMDQ